MAMHAIDGSSYSFTMDDRVNGNDTELLIGLMQVPSIQALAFDNAQDGGTLKIPVYRRHYDKKCTTSVTPPRLDLTKSYSKRGRTTRPLTVRWKWTGLVETSPVGNISCSINRVGVSYIGLVLLNESITLDAISRCFIIKKRKGTNYSICFTILNIPESLRIHFLPRWIT